MFDEDAASMLKKVTKAFMPKSKINEPININHVTQTTVNNIRVFKLVKRVVFEKLG